MSRVLILKGDDWQACYIDGKCVEQGHSLGEGLGVLYFLKEKSKEYSFGLDDVEEKWIDDDDLHEIYKAGCFPDTLEELKGNYK